MTDAVDRLRALQTAVAAYLAVDDELAPAECRDGGVCLTWADAARQSEAEDALRAALVASAWVQPVVGSAAPAPVDLMEATQDALQAAIIGAGELRAERDQARGIAVELEQENAAVREDVESLRRERVEVIAQTVANDAVVAENARLRAGRDELRAVVDEVRDILGDSLNHVKVAGHGWCVPYGQLARAVAEAPEGEAQAGCGCDSPLDPHTPELIVSEQEARRLAGGMLEAINRGATLDELARLRTATAGGRTTVWADGRPVGYVSPGGGGVLESITTQSVPSRCVHGHVAGCERCWADEGDAPSLLGGAE